MKIFYVIVFTAVLFVGYQKVNAYQLKDNRMNVAKFKKAISRKNIQLVDVRTLAEFNKGHIENSIQIDVLSKENFKKEIKKLDITKPTYIYCRSGKRSLTALKIMKAQGFKTIYDLEGGYISWSKK